MNNLNQSSFSQQLHFVNQYIRAIAHLYHYEEKLTNKDDEAINLVEQSLEIIDTSQIQTYIPLQNLNSYQINPICNKTLNQLISKFFKKSRFGINLEKSDLISLQPNQWLNDNVLSYFLNLLVISLNRPCYLFNTFFYGKLSESIASVDHWFFGVNIFRFRFHLIPIHFNGNHWMLICSDLNRSKVILFDSFHQMHPEILNKIRDFYQRHYLKQYEVPLPHEWQFVYAKSIPLQKNGYDCGVFVCKFAELFLRESNYYSFLSRDCDFFRKKITYSLLLDEFN